MEYARSAGVPGVLEVNAPLIEEQAQYRQLFDRAGAEGAARRVFKAASVIVAVSEEVADYLGRYPETQGRVEVVANGVDADEFMPKVQRDGSPADGFTVGFVGSLKPWHGLPNLVAAFATVREHALDARLLIVGDGPERARLEEIVAVGGLRDSVRLTGAVSHREVPALLATMDVAVAPYPKLENFYFSPLKVYEYMAAGLAVIASRTGQVAKLIDDGVSGLLYEPGEVGAMAAAIDRLRLAPEFRRSLGRAARAAILRGHTWEAVMQRILQITRSRSRSARADQSVAG